jgi:KDO2-lipid IV(A) lauroyltransferase
MMAQKEDTQPRAGRLRSQNKDTVLRSLIANVPAKRILCTGNLLGALIYLLDISHRRIVRRNLRFAYPDWSSEHIRRVSKRVYGNLGIMLLEIVQVASFSQKDIETKISIQGTDNIRRALARDRGLIIISAHLGNWEVGLQVLSYHLPVPISGPAKRIRFKPLNRWLNRMRSRFGIEVISKKGALQPMRQALRSGKAIGLLIDQGKRSESVNVRFFNHLVTAPSAAAMLALRCRSPVVPAFCVREAEKKLTIYIQAPLDLQRTDNLRSDLVTNTQIMTDSIEKMVRRYPHQWLWLHKRWKKHYPQLYPEYNARRQRRKEKERRKALQR